MKIVFDTNVIISGLYSKRGASYQLLKVALSSKLAFAISPLVALEYEGKINQKIEESFLRVSKKDCEKILDALFAMAEPVWEPVQIRPILVDLTDDKMLECAVSGGCTHIVTFNKKHFPLPSLIPYGIRVMTAGEFFKIWRDKS